MDLPFTRETRGERGQRSTPSRLPPPSDSVSLISIPNAIFLPGLAHFPLHFFTLASFLEQRIRPSPTRSRQLRKNPRSFFFSDSTKGKGIVSKNFSSRIGFKIFRFPFDPRAPAWKRNAELYPGIRFIISFNSFLY